MWYGANKPTESLSDLMARYAKPRRVPSPPVVKPMLTPFSPEAVRLVNQQYRKKKSLTGESLGKHLSTGHDWDDADFLTDARRQRHHLSFGEHDNPPFRAVPFIPTNLARAQETDPSLDLTSHIQPFSNKTDDLLEIALRGAHGADWYDEWRDILDRHPLSPQEAEVAKKLFGVTGQATSVKQNYGLFHTVNSRLRNGFLKDPDTITDLKRRGILPAMNKYDPTVHNLYDASAGRDVRTPKIRDYTAPFFGEPGGAIDDWMLRLFTGRAGAPKDREYDYIQGRLRSLVADANRVGLGGRTDWDINKIQASLWVGYKDKVAGDLEHALQIIQAHPASPANNPTLISKIQGQIDDSRESGAAADVLSRYGMLDEQGNPKELKRYRVHALLGRHIDTLKHLNDAGVRYEFGNKIPIVKGERLLQQLIDQNPDLTEGRVEIRNGYVWGDKYRIDRLVNEGRIVDHAGNEIKLDKHYLRGAPGKDHDILSLLIQLGEHKAGKGAESYLAGPHTEVAIQQALQQPQFAHDMAEIHRIGLLKKQMVNPTLQKKLRDLEAYLSTNPQDAQAQAEYQQLKGQTDPFASYTYDVGKVAELIAARAHAHSPLPEEFVPSFYHTPEPNDTAFSYDLDQHRNNWRWYEAKPNEEEDGTTKEAASSARQVRYAMLLA